MKKDIAFIVIFIMFVLSIDLAAFHFGSIARRNAENQAAAEQQAQITSAVDAAVKAAFAKTGH
jgi:hypothetical protein